MKKETRETVCNFIKDKLLHLEKYATTANKNKVTYVMIPFDHPTYKFPFNLEDRLKYKITMLKKLINREIDYKTIKGKDGTFMGEKNLPSYVIEFSDNKYTQAVKKDLEKEGFELSKNKWRLIVD